MEKYTPQPNDVVICEETTFSMLVVSYDAATRLCSLIGIDPATNQAVSIPRVCPDFIRLATPNSLQVGDTVRYKSGSPLMVVTNFSGGELTDNVDLLAWEQGRKSPVQTTNVNPACLVKVTA